MEEICRVQILEEIERIWKAFKKDDLQSNGVWIAEYKFVDIDFEGIFSNEIIENVYFLDNRGISLKEIESYKSFINFSENSIKNKNANTFVNGLSMFAKYRYAENSYYFCYQFGKRHGKGYQIKFNEKGEVIKYENIWVS